MSNGSFQATKDALDDGPMSVGQCINWETRFTAKEISGLSIISSGLKPPPWTRVFTSLKLATFMTCLNGQEVQQVNPLLVERLGVGLDWSGSYKSQAQTPTSSKRKIYKIRAIYSQSLDTH